MSIAAWAPFLVLCLTVELTPGPNMAYLAILSAGSGRRAGFSAVAGIALGLACVGFVAALGVAEIVRNRPLVAQGLASAVLAICSGWHGRHGARALTRWKRR